MRYDEVPLTELLQKRPVFSIFDEEFRHAGWLDVTVLLGSESTIKGLEDDGTVPPEVMSRIRERIEELLQSVTSENASET